MSCQNCLCLTCANNGESLNTRPGEASFPCYYCDACIMFIGSIPGAVHTKRLNCEHYKMSEHSKEAKDKADDRKASKARKFRASFRVIVGGAGKAPEE